LHGTKYVDQLLYAESECESDIYADIKQKIVDYINEEKAAHNVTSASVYVRIYNTHGEWFCINADEQYHASSLFKLPILIAFAKMAELNPAILDQKVQFNQPDYAELNQKYISKKLVPGQVYTIRELLKYLIAYSDNHALHLLYNYHNPAIYKKVFTDLDLPYHENASSGPITVKVKEYSVLLRVLYNGSYLSTQSSEFALDLLSQSDFKYGIKQGIPDSVTIAHKFGEYFTPTEAQLHESAVIYTSKHNYIITVMTKGKDMNQLSTVMGNISKIAYNSIAEQ
jgi:beta-lactamase class A